MSRGGMPDDFNKQIPLYFFRRKFVNQNFEIVISNLKAIFPNANLELDWPKDSFGKINLLMSMKNIQGDGWLHLLSRSLNKSNSPQYQELSQFLISLIGVSYSFSIADAHFMSNLMNERNNNKETFLSILVEAEKPNYNSELISKLIADYLTFIDFDAELKLGTLSQIIDNNFPNLFQKIVPNKILNLYPELKSKTIPSNINNDHIFFQPEKYEDQEVSSPIHDGKNESNDAPAIRPKFFSNENLD